MEKYFYKYNLVKIVPRTNEKKYFYHFFKIGHITSNKKM